MMVGLIRFLTLCHSNTTFRMLLIAIVLSSALTCYLAFQDPSIITNSITLATTTSTGQRDFLPLLALPLVATFVAFAIEALWFLSVKVRDDIYVPAEFVASLQGSLQKEKVCYTRGKIREAYAKAIEDVTSSEGIWEICWLANTGSRSEKFYNQLIEKTARRIAVEKRYVNSYREYDLLDKAQQDKCLKHAQKHLELNGKFLIYFGSKEGIARFERAMGFSPGLLHKRPRIRFMIINQRVLISSWPAHDLRNQMAFRSTICSRTEDPRCITNYLNFFESLWGESQLAHIGPILANLKAIHHVILKIINDRTSTWSLDELTPACKMYDHRYTDVQITDAVQTLGKSKQVVVYRSGRVSRNRNLYMWQNRWLRVRYQEGG